MRSLVNKRSNHLENLYRTTARCNLHKTLNNYGVQSIHVCVQQFYTSSKHILMLRMTVDHTKQILALGSKFVAKRNHHLSRRPDSFRSIFCNYESVPYIYIYIIFLYLLSQIGARQSQEGSSLIRPTKSALEPLAKKIKSSHMR